VYCVAVEQPVQSWNVVRSHDEFVCLGQALRQVLNLLPPCPSLTDIQGNLQAPVQARNELQNWLTSILMYPGAREAPSLSQFLTVGVNTMPPHYEHAAWTQFNGTPVESSAVNSGLLIQPVGSRNGNLDDMEMADMFGDEAGGHGEPPDEVDDEEEDYVPSAFERYKPADHSITAEDQMDMVGEVEMVEDIGSLAQSLGASHLGRSLNLQAEMKHPSQQRTFQQPVQGLNVGGASQQQRHGQLTGGLGSAMANAAERSNDGFHQVAPTSVPRLDSFKMIRVIGKGSFGKVFLVNEKKTNHIYALKVLRKDNIIRRNQVEHTKTERSVLGYVRHPFIVGMNMAFQSKDKLYFVLDFCAGGELFFHLGKLGKFPEPRARFYAAEILTALNYVHSLDIVYRDLKPENVLLTAQGHIRLTDFGLSKEGISNSSSGAHSFCGTPEYLAPEILSRQGHGRAVDWWSLGALLYEMLTGLPPFYCQDRDKLFHKIQSSDLLYPASVSCYAKRVLQGLLTKDPEKRLGSGKTDATEIKCHIFFEEIDWDKLARGEILPPWRPEISGNLDTSQFDKEFTNMPVFSPPSMQRNHVFGATPSDSHFEGFTYTDRGVLRGYEAKAGR
jgi:serine/threonine protein kinase